MNSPTLRKKENEDFTSVVGTTLVNNGAVRKLQDYAVSVRMAEHLAMMVKTLAHFWAKVPVRIGVEKMSDWKHYNGLFSIKDKKLKKNRIKLLTN